MGNLYTPLQAQLLPVTCHLWLSLEYQAKNMSKRNKLIYGQLRSKEFLL